MSLPLTLTSDHADEHVRDCGRPTVKCMFMQLPAVPVSQRDVFS